MPRPRAQRCWTHDSFPPRSPCLLFTSAGATGSARLRTGTATRAPTALPAMEEDAGITYATKVCGAIWFSYQEAETLPPPPPPRLTPLCLLICRDRRDPRHERSGEAPGSPATSHHGSADSKTQTQTVCPQETGVRPHRIPNAILKPLQQRLFWYKKMHFEYLEVFFSFFFFPTLVFVSSQLRTSSVRLGCGTNVEGLPATGQICVKVSLAPLSFNTDLISVSSQV